MTSLSQNVVSLTDKGGRLLLYLCDILDSTNTVIWIVGEVLGRSDDDLDLI